MNEKEQSLMFASGKAVDDWQKKNTMTAGDITKVVCRYAASASSLTGFETGILAFFDEIKRQSDARGIDAEVFYSDLKNAKN